MLLSFYHLTAQEMDSIHQKMETLLLHPADSSMIVGELKRLDIQTGDFGKFFMDAYRAYVVNNDLLSTIENYIYQYSVTIVMATWCHDSKEQVPRFYKILDKLDYNTENVSLIGVDRSKLADDIDISEMNIKRVPTFIFYKDGKEKGRIIETPETILEKDILNILSN
jgi:thiol-disulfide isomerase/thioredoxin